MLTAPGVLNINAVGTSSQGTWQVKLLWCQTPRRHRTFARQNDLAEHYTDNGKIFIFNRVRSLGFWIVIVANNYHAIVKHVTACVII